MGPHRSRLRIGVAGHRWLAEDATAFVAAAFRTILARAVETGDVTAVSALADGADSLFAEAALDLGIPLETVRPFDDYATDFPTAAVRARYERLRAAARREARLPFARRSVAAYVAGMRRVVDGSDLLVAVWDGEPAPGPGGTIDAIEWAVRRRRPWLHVDVSSRDAFGVPRVRSADR
jgi:hypothetical protein